MVHGGPPLSPAPLTPPPNLHPRPPPTPPLSPLPPSPLPLSPPPPSLEGCSAHVQKEVPTSAHDVRPTPAVTFLDVRMPPPAALFNLTRKHWLSTTSFHSTTLVPHPANLPEPSWSKLTLSTRTHEHDEHLSPRPRSGSPWCLGCTRQSTHAVTVSAPPMPTPMPVPMPMPMPMSQSTFIFPTISPTPAAAPTPPATLPSSAAAPPATHVRHPFAEYPPKLIAARAALVPLPCPRRALAPWRAATRSR